MSFGVNVYLWGSKIGTVAQKDISSVPVFTYDKKFIKSGIQVSPIMMPLSEKSYSFPSLNEETFHKLPGLLADSLPDKFGTKLISDYLGRQGRSIEDLTAIERLCFTGSRGMGALEFVPEHGEVIPDQSIDIDELANLANEILANRETMHVKADHQAIAQLIKTGTSAGGARAKALIAWNESTGDIRSGQINAGDGYSYWLLKFGTVSNNKDKDVDADDKEYQKIEYAYSLMTKDAGIDMSECRLIKSTEGLHFATKRFDRDSVTGKKIHMQSLGAIAHFDFNDPGAHSYEETAVIMRKIGLKQDAIEQLFKRIVFNEVSKNYDDHVKNISFLMDRKGIWTLSPAYDMTFSYNPQSIWTSKHQMRINGKRDHLTLNDLIECGKSLDIKEAQIHKILEHIIAVVREWPQYAKYVGLSQKNTDYIKSHHAYSDFYKNYSPFTPALDTAKQEFPEACAEIDQFAQKEIGS